MDHKIRLQLPNVSFEQANQIDSLTSTSSELEMEGDSDSETNGEDELSPCHCSSNTSKNAGLHNLYDILMELPSIKKAAWARRKAAVISAKNTSRHATNTNQGSRNKVTFTRHCCQKKGSSLEISSQHTSTSNTPDSALGQANGDNMSECESENARSRRELFKMQSINLYHTILPPSLFTNYPVQRRQF